ncbi:MAG: response regulator [Verrucomicrobiota bacterium]
MRFFVETILRNHGYHVLGASDVDEAVRLFQEHSDEVSLLFTDVGLPKVDGIALGERLRQVRPRLPIVLASGYPTKEFKDRLTHLGPQGFLSKPYNMQELLQTVRRRSTARACCIWRRRDGVLGWPGLLVVRACCPGLRARHCARTGSWFQRRSQTAATASVAGARRARLRMTLQPRRPACSC